MPSCSSLCVCTAMSKHSSNIQMPVLLNRFSILPLIFYAHEQSELFFAVLLWVYSQRGLEFPKCSVNRCTAWVADADYGVMVTAQMILVLSCPTHLRRANLYFRYLEHSSPLNNAENVYIRFEFSNIRWNFSHRRKGKIYSIDHCASTFCGKF